MTNARRWAGYGILCLATLGLIACLAGIAGTWALKIRVDAVGAAAFGAADEAFVFVEAKLDLVKQGLENSRPTVDHLEQLAERLKSAEPDVRQACQPLLQTVDDLRREFQSAESWLESSAAIASGIQQISAAALSSEFAAARPDAVALDLVRDVQTVATEVAGAMDQLQALWLALVELRDSGVLAREVVLAIVDRVADLDARIARLRGRVVELDGKVAGARASCSEQGRRFAWWTRLTALGASILPLWFGLSQIVMMVWGWKIAHSPPIGPPAEGENPHSA